jgi:hypothetical protein
VVIAPRVLQVGPNAPYDTIAVALGEARSGDTVDVAAGEYREAVQLKSGVTVRSHVPRAAILRAAPVGTGPAVFAQDVENARFSGFRILADPKIPLSAGIVLVNSQVEVDSVEVAGAGVGIEIRGERSPTVQSASIHDSTGEGILINGPSAPWLLHNNIQRNGRAGLAARDGAHPALVGNVFEKNPVELGPDVPMDTVREMNFFLDVKPARGGKKR